MNQIGQAAPVADDRIDFLDLLGIVAESWKLIVVGTSLVAIAVAIALFLMPQAYESISALPLSARLRVALYSANVLDPVIIGNKLAANFGGDIEATRESLRRKIKAEELEKDSGFYRIRVQGDTPAQAQALATSYLTQLLQQSKPTGSEAQKVQDKIVVARDTIADLQKLSERLLAGSSTQLSSANGPGKVDDDAQSRILAIPVEIARRKAEILRFEHELGGLKGEDILEQPSLPTKPIAQQRMRTLLGAVGGGFVALILFAYLRELFSKAAKDSERARKIDRIRIALGLGGKKEQKTA